MPREDGFCMKVDKKGEDEQFQVKGKGSQGFFPRDVCAYSCCSRRGFSRGAVHLSVAILVVELRPSAPSVTLYLCDEAYFCPATARCRGNTR